LNYLGLLVLEEITPFLAFPQGGRKGKIISPLGEIRKGVLSEKKEYNILC